MGKTTCDFGISKNPRQPGPLLTWLWRGFFANCALLQEQYARPEVNACMTSQRPCSKDKVASFCPEIDWATLEPRCKSLARDGG